MKELEAVCLNMRRNLLKLSLQASHNGVHISPALSIIEIMAVLYKHEMKLDKYNTEWDDRDRFILSKGHGALAYYLALYEAEIISKEQLYSYEEYGGNFPGQPSKNLSLGIEYSSGSLGMGISFGAGIALAARKRDKNFRTYVLVGDGESNEGNIWEAVMFAAHNKLSNLTVIVDRNGMQSDGASSEILKYNIESVWASFDWHVVECDGHSVQDLVKAFSECHTDRPSVIIANTIKGKGISFMEKSRDWHHGRLTQELYEKAVTELEGCYHA